MIKNIIKKIYFINLYMNKRVKIKTTKGVDLKTKFEGNNIINKNTQIMCSNIGYGTYIGQNSRIERSKIGRYCSIASNVKTVIYTHPTKNIVSTHPAFFSNKGQAGFSYVIENFFEETKYIDKKQQISVIIGNDVWIGENVIILGGVEIGDGAIIGAGSIVTKNVEPYSINVGIPSKKIKYRFEEDEINFLKRFKWWDKEESWIIKNIENFKDIKKFIKESEGKNE